MYLTKVQRKPEAFKNVVQNRRRESCRGEGSEDHDTFKPTRQEATCAESDSWLAVLAHDLAPTGLHAGPHSS